ncbi:MAG: fused MFS/spermidine synthase [Pirellulaceae bacterium]|nr:fused MFS/spermidine synthase [Pirellulaceae bacterium]
MSAAIWQHDCGPPDDTILAEECQPLPTPNWRSLSIWLLLPALASVLLLATTNHVCQDVAVVPFLWVAPLSLYLLTFIICFDREHWYSRSWTAGLAIVSVVALCVLMQYEHGPGLFFEVGLHFSVMFLVCMVCHGELARSKPSPRYLTKFYLMSSAGGAFGGLLVALVCPLVFSTNLELHIALLIAVAVSLCVFVLEARRTWLGASAKRQWIAWPGGFAVILFVSFAHYDELDHDTIVTERNFYGVLHVERPAGARGTILMHGRTVHGFQFDDPKMKLRPTTYYSYGSGIGRTLHQQNSAAPLRVGAIGLGTGTVACYGQVGDLYRFYEINPAMVRIAYEQFSFLDESQAEVEIVLGDPRLSLEREPDQSFDVLILDAFSSDSIPTHLLTREAFDVYKRHLKPDGIIAVHVSNRFLRLEPVVLRLAKHVGMDCVKINNPVDPVRAVLASQWMLMTRTPEFLQHEVIQPVAIRFNDQSNNDFPLWTDQYNNLLQIMKIH